MTSGKIDEMKGRVKEAAGALTGNKKLKEGEGRPGCWKDQAGSRESPKEDRGSH